MKFRSVFLLCSALALSSCEKATERIARSIDDAMGTVERVGTPFNQNVQNANGILKQTLGDVEDGNIRREMQLTIDHLQQAADSGVYNVVDFSRARVREDLAALKAFVRGGTVPPREPYVGSASPLSIRFSSTGQQIVNLAGWNLDKQALASHFAIFVARADGIRKLPGEIVTSPTPYQIVLNFSPDTTSGLRRGDTAVIGKWKDKELFSIPILQPLPDREAVLDIVVPNLQKSDPVKLVPNGNGKVGNHDLDAEDRRPNPPRCSQNSSVELTCDRDRVYFRIDVCFNEALPDFTRLQSESGRREIFRLLPAGPEVNSLRASLNLGNEYANANPEIVRIVSATSGKADIPEYTTDAVDHAPANGCVEDWAFDGDRDGDDDSANVVVRLKNIQVIVAFKLPDGAVGLSVDPANTLSKGIKLN